MESRFEIYHYTLMADAFTEGMPTLKVPVAETSAMYNTYGPGQMLEGETRLYDLATDPGQERPIRDPGVEGRMAGLMAGLIADLDAPPEAFARLSLPRARHAAE
jgi:hypothetical protein